MVSNRPTLEEIKASLHEIAEANRQPTDFDPGVIIMDNGDLFLGDEILTATAILAGWDSITPDNNDGLVTDPNHAKVLGAFTDSPLWKAF